MPLVLNEEQRMLRDSVRDFVKDNANVDHFRKLRDEGDGKPYDPDTWAKLAELGISGICIPETHGGLEFGYLAMGAVFEEFGKQLTASPLLSSAVLGASLIELAGNDAQKSKYLPAIASGEMTVAVAIEEGSHHAPLYTMLPVTESEGGFVLNGRKAFVIDGQSADLLIVLGRSSGGLGDTDGLTLLLLDQDPEGLQRENDRMVDSRDYADLVFTDAKLSSSALLGTVGEAFEPLVLSLDRARACLAAEMLGGAQEMFDRTMAYLQERDQFGQKIGSFQALQHRAADMYTELELTRSTVMDALSALDEQRDDISQAVSTAKCRINDTALHIANEAVQMHGGIGVTDELDIGLFFKRCHVSINLLGNSGYHSERFAGLNGF
ncbi:MAG: acyl-CoA dehydrogenase family protein [Pseudomonadales bacterium]